jgi:hypothetical protein
MSRKLGILDIHQQAAERPAQFYPKRIVQILVLRQLAEWVVTGVLARAIKPKTVLHGLPLKARYTSLAQLRNYLPEHDSTPLPPSELPGIKFEEPLRRKREVSPCAVIS